MTVRLTLDIPDEIMDFLQETAAAELRSPKSQALWFLREAYGRQARIRAPNSTDYNSRLHLFQPVFTELERLHLQAGKPSSRTVAQLIRKTDGGYTVGHSTVHTVLNGSAVPTWPVLDKITVALNGDILAMKQLWMTAAAASSQPSARDRTGP